MQPVETTLYSLSDEPPTPSGDCERREGERHMTLYRVGSILVDDRRELQPGLAVEDPHQIAADPATADESDAECAHLESGLWQN